MRLDKLTTKLQEVLTDAQSLAVGNENQFIDPVHLLLAFLSQDEGSARSLLQRANGNIGGLTKSLESALKRLPKVSGTGGEVQIGREPLSLLNLADRKAQKRGGQVIASEMVLLALTEERSEAGRRGTMPQQFGHGARNIAPALRRPPSTSACLSLQ